MGDVQFQFHKGSIKTLFPRSRSMGDVQISIP